MIDTYAERKELCSFNHMTIHKTPRGVTAVAEDGDVTVQFHSPRGVLRGCAQALSFGDHGQRVHNGVTTTETRSGNVCLMNEHGERVVITRSQATVLFSALGECNFD